MTEVIIETQQHGKQMRITAIDVETGREVVTIAPISLSQEELHRLAIRKLNYVLGREADS